MNAVRSGQSIDKGASLRIGVSVAGSLAAGIAGWFIVSYDNPLTATLIIAAITIFVLAILNPKAGLYLLVIVTGYIDLVKRLGILAGDLPYSDVVVPMAVVSLLFVFVFVGAGAHNGCRLRAPWG